MPIKETARQTVTKRLVLDGFIGGLHSPEVFTKTAILETETPSAVNVEFWPIGTITKRHGKQHLHPITGPVQNTAITLVTQWWNPAGANYILAFTCMSGSVSADVWSFTPSAGDGTFVTLLCGCSGMAEWTPSIDDSITFAAFAGSAIFTNGLDPTFTFDGQTIAELAQAPSGVRYLTTYRNTLFAAGGLNPSTSIREASTIRWSNPGDPTVWPVENYMELDADDGDEITGIWVLGTELIVFKESKIYAVSYVGGQFQYYAELRVDGTGCSSYDSIITLGSYCYFYGIDAFYKFDGRILTSISDKIQDLVLNINPASRSRVYSNVYIPKSQLWFLVGYLNSINHNYVFIYDLDRQNWTMFTIEAACLGVYQSVEDLTWNDLTESWDSYSISWGDRVFLTNSDILVTGAYDGIIFSHDSLGVDSDNNVAYIGNWQSKWIDFDEPDYNKRILRMTLLLSKQTAGDLAVGIKKDWEDSVYCNSYTVSMTGTEARDIIERRIDFTLYCRAFQVELKTTEINRPFQVHKIVIEYVPKGRTLV